MKIKRKSSAFLKTQNLGKDSKEKYYLKLSLVRLKGETATN